MHYKVPKKYYFLNKFKKSEINNIKNNIAIIYRNYNKKYCLSEIIKLRKFCNNKNIKLIIANNFKIALKVRADGAYIPSFNKDIKHLSYQLRQNFIVLGSAHNIKELRIKEKQKVSVVFISSIFKKNKNYLGKFRFMNLKKMTKRKVVALGGIKKENIKIVKVLNCFGYAGISFFKKKGPG